MGVLHWFAHVLAFDSTSDDYYAANSGALGSWILPPFFTVTGLYVGWRWHNRCAIRHCLKRAKFDADGHKICHAHAGRHKHLSLEHLAHFHRTGIVPKPVSPSPSTSTKE